MIMAQKNHSPNQSVLAFYFPLYATKERDGAWLTWDQNHHDPDKGDLAGFFYPKLGPYSNGDPAVIKKHFKWARRAGIGIMAVSWWRPWHKDRHEGIVDEHIADKRMNLLLGEAHRHGLKIAIMSHDRRQSPEDFKNSVTYFREQGYFKHPAYWWIIRPTKYAPKDKPRPVVFQWRSGHQDAPGRWAAAYDQIHRDSDTIIIPKGEENQPWLMDDWHADGLFIWSTAGSNLSGYPAWVGSIKNIAGIAVPATCPGFNNQRTDNGQDVRDEEARYQVLPRKKGDTYRDSWRVAKQAGPEYINITSFNMWNESTAIEPAIVKSHPDAGDLYKSYEGAYGKTGEEAELAYIDATKQHAEGWNGYRPENEIKIIHAFRGILGRDPSGEDLAGFTRDMLGGSDELDICMALVKCEEFMKDRGRMDPKQFAKELWYYVLERKPAPARLEKTVRMIEMDLAPEECSNMLTSQAFRNDFLSSL
jgi:hypothetical protein